MGRADAGEEHRRAWRHHARFTALVGAAAVGCAAGFANGWTQRHWLAGKWLYRTPSGLLWLAASAAVSCSALAWLALAWRRGRWRSTSYAPLRWVLPAAFGAWVYGWTIRPPTVVYDAQLAISVAGAVWSASVALLAQRSDRPRPRWARILDFVAFEVAVCALAGECALRLVRSATRLQLLATSGSDVDTWIRAHRLEPGTYHLGFPVDSSGFVDREPADASRREHLVACIGDSFSVGVVPHDRHYTTVAEGCFDDLEVYNIGVANAGPREYQRLLATGALPLHPDLVVIALFVGNDVTDSSRSGTLSRPAWMDRGEVLIVQLPRRLWALARERRAGAPTAAGGMLLESFGIRRTESLSAAEVELRMPWLSDPLLEPAMLSVERFEYVQAARAEITLPRMRSAYADVLASLERMRATALAVPIACFLIPDEYQVEDAQWKRLLARGLEPGADRELPQKILGAWLDERGIPYLDLLPRLRSSPPLSDGNLHVYHLRDTHLNARGNRIAGIALAELIERCGVARRTRTR